MKFGFSLITLVLFFEIKAQAPEKFYARYGGNGYDVGYDVKQTLDKGYIITGSTSSMGVGNTDMYLLKLDSMGHVKFQNTFGNANNDIGKEVIQLIDSSYVIVGYTNSIGFGGYDIFLVKADKYGILQWQKTIGSTDWDFANSLQQTTDGGFIIAGSTYGYGYGNEDGYVIKTDANGNITWSKTFGGTEDDSFKSVIQTTDGGYALCGTTKSYGDTNGDAWVFKLLANGDSAYSYKYNLGLYDAFNDIKELPIGEFILGGAKTYNGAKKRESVFIKINTLGQILLQSEDGQTGSDEEYFSVSLSNSSFGVYTVLENSNENGPTFKEQVKLLLLDAGGYYVNGGAIGSSDDDLCYSFDRTKDKSKGYVLTGFTKNYGSVLTDVFIIKFDSVLALGTNVTSLVNLTHPIERTKIYPSPFEKNINIQFDAISNEEIEVKVLTLDGKILFQKSTSMIDQNLDLSFLNHGFYFLQLTSKSGYQLVYKIIKQSYK